MNAAHLPEDLTSTTDVATRLNVTPASIRNWIKAKRIRGWKVGKDWKVSLAEAARLATPVRGGTDAAPAIFSDNFRHAMERLRTKGML